MELVQLMQLLKDKNPPPFSVWFGEEQKIIDIYLSDALICDFRAFWVDSIVNVLPKLKKSLLDNSKKVFIVTEDKSYLKQDNKWADIKKRIEDSGHIVVMRYSKIKKNTAFYKAHKDVCIEFNRLDAEVLKNYIKKDLPDIEDTIAFKLIEICQKDYGRICLEVDKIKQLMSAKSIDCNTAYKLLIRQDGIYQPVGDITFSLTDAVLYGDVGKAAKYLRLAKLKNEPAMMIASILYKGFRNMLAYQGLGRDKSDATSRTGLDNKELWVVKKNIGGYSTKELQRNALICQQVEAGIKMGLIEQDIALDYLVLKCMA